MISDLANKQNQTHRKELEGMGYKFSIGHDGWTLWYMKDIIDSGTEYKYDKGEQTYRACLDAAVASATKHRSDHGVTIIKNEKVTTKPANAVTAPTVINVAVSEAPALSRIQRKTVEAAINLLASVNAEYRIVTAGEVFTNMPERKVSREPRNDFLPLYGPILKPFEGKGPFATAIPIPENVDRIKFVNTVQAYLRSHYGKGNSLTETTATEITVLVTAAEIRE